MQGLRNVFLLLVVLFSCLQVTTVAAEETGAYCQTPTIIAELYVTSW